VRYKLSDSDDEFFAETRPSDAKWMRSDYRLLRHYGVPRSTARTIIHGAFHAGYRTALVAKP
jgi:hypothetical protein